MCVLIIQTLKFFLENYIDGKEFLNLNEQEVRSMVLPIGLAKKILCLSKEVKIVYNQFGIL